MPESIVYLLAALVMGALSSKHLTPSVGYYLYLTTNPTDSGQMMVVFAIYFSACLYANYRVS